MTKFLEQTQQPNEVKLPELNNTDAMSVKTKVSKMSGASNLSKFNEKVKHEHHSDEEDFEDLEINERKHVQRSDFANEGDEWNAICLFNQKQFEEEKKLNKLKDMEIKKRTKDDLDNQIRQKLRRLNEEQLKNQEYDHILLAHCDHLNDLEKQRQAEVKAKVLKEKEVK